MATPPAATLRRWAPTVTTKSPRAGIEVPSSGSLKVAVSLFPSTSAFTNTGAPSLLATGTSEKFSTKLPAISTSGPLCAHSSYELRV